MCCLRTLRTLSLPCIFTVGKDIRITTDVLCYCFPKSSRAVVKVATYNFKVDIHTKVAVSSLLVVIIQNQIS